MPESASTGRQVTKSSGADASSSRLHRCWLLERSTWRCATAYTSAGSTAKITAAAKPSVGDCTRPSSPTGADPFLSDGRRTLPFARGPKDVSSGSASSQYSPGRRDVTRVG